MTQRKKLTDQVADALIGGKRSVRYLRVSDPRQMDTDADFTADGNSIDTQRKEAIVKEQAMGLTNVGEYIEPGNSAQSIEKRPVFREMLRRIVEEGDVDYVIIYVRSRVFRNHFDATVTKRQLLKLGVRLISAKEDFGEGIMADAMEAITDIFNEVQVRLSGQDIKVKMGNKAKNGGTLGRARVGYLNVRRRIDGREIRTVDVDAERAPYVRQAFEWFATGRYSAERLQEKLTDAGLRLAATAKWPSRPISESTLLVMLRDRYYVGEVLYEGVWYPGRHEPLVTPDLFDRVQRVMDSRQGAGTRARQHPHYLKGTVFCGRCKTRFIVQRAQGNGGVYFYFFCRGRQDGLCDQPYVPVEVMEEVVARHYGRMPWLSAALRQQMRTDLHAAVAETTDLPPDVRAKLDRRLVALDRKEDYFLDLAAEEGWPKDKLRIKVQALRDEKRQIERTLKNTDRPLATGQAVLEQALDLLDDPGRLYETSGESVRLILNKAFFTRLYVDGRKTSGQELEEPFDLLHEMYEISQGRTGDSGQPYRRGARTLSGDDDPQNAVRGTLLAENASNRKTVTHLLRRHLAGGGSSKRVLVGIAGFEPATSPV